MGTDLLKDGQNCLWWPYHHMRPSLTRLRYYHWLRWYLHLTGLADSGFVWLQLNLILCTFGRLKRWEALHSWYTEEVRGSVLSLIHFCHMWITHGGCTWYWLLAPHLHWADRGPPVPCVSWVWLASFSQKEGLRWDLPIIDKWNKCRLYKGVGAKCVPLQTWHYYHVSLTVAETVSGW